MSQVRSLSRAFFLSVLYMVVKGPGGITLNKNSLQSLVNSRKLYVNLDEFLKNRNSRYNYGVWNDSGKLVGFALMKPNKNSKSLSLELIVTQKGGGYGKQLMNAIKTLSKNITLVSVPAARQFYMNQGFVPNGKYGFVYRFKNV